MVVGEELYDAKIRVLGEMVKQQEEEELLPAVELAGMNLKAADRMDELLSEPEI